MYATGLIDAKDKRSVFCYLRKFYRNILSTILKCLY